MKDAMKTKTRRDFLRDGMRTILLSGLGFMGLFFGWKGFSTSGNESSCFVDLPCQGCSRFSGCQYPRALDVKQKERDSLHQSSRMNSGGDGVR
jgi:hypothetical protein